jgi:hypothetical protein
MRAALLALPFCLALPIMSEAQEAKRQLGTHEHGKGFLNMALEGNRLTVELQAPGSDIARSETKPDTPERKAAVAAAIATLEKPLDLFRLPAEAGCTMTSAKARMTVIGEDDHKPGTAASHGKPGHEKGHGHAKHAAHGDHKAGDGHRGHSDYHGEYQFTCATPARLTTVELTYFKAFPRAEKLSIQLIGPKGQTQAEATTAKPVVSLAAAF